MATVQQSTKPAGLRIETAFHHTSRNRWQEGDGERVGSGDRAGNEGDRTNIFHDYDAPRCGTDDERSVLNSLHSSTPPISVPRHDDNTRQEVDLPHRPEDVEVSPFGSFLNDAQPSLGFDPATTTILRGQRSEKPLSQSEKLNNAAQRFQPQRASSLRNILPPDDNGVVSGMSQLGFSPGPRRSRTQQEVSAGYSRGLATSPNGTAMVCPTSLTSLSTVSPVIDEAQTPPETSRGMLSPVCIASPEGSYNSPGGRSSWSGASATIFDSKPGRLRSSTRHSRRSTASSGKSQASMFLSMWNSREEPAPKPDDEGQMVGTDYVLGKVIGSGGFSVVKEAYKVEESGEPKTLAVKIVKKQIPNRTERENDAVQAEFDHEVRVWRWLSHPNILSLEAVYDTDYATFCFTKLAIGGTLFDLIRQNRKRGISLDIQLAKKYSYQLACALRYLHEDARVVHRDIKLENCLLDPVELADGTRASNLVLCDFGMAEWINADSEDDSSDVYEDAGDRPPPRNIGPSEFSTSVAGSLEYAPPELLESKTGIIDPSVDIWAFGVIVFTMVVGSRPFQDSFQPRLVTNICSGRWDRDAVLGDGADLEARQDALELITGCLDMNCRKRWTVRDILSSRWLQEFAEASESPSEASWKL
ncbi:kinase-like domain-containing protein [Aspergillus egyptiacus]|nr:kinase-like domain-containing protein [Aspergillus egyptiacus]